MSVPEDRDSVVAHLRANTPGFADLTEEEQDSLIDRQVLMARELNEAAALWDALPHEVWES